MIEWRLVSRVAQQMKAIMRGVHELIPDHLLKIFDANELEMVLCGIQKIDVKDWKTHTEYKGYSPNSVTVQLFWRVRFLHQKV